MNKILIAVDAGKHTCKAVCRTATGDVKRVSFLNQYLTLSSSLDLDIQGNSYKVSYQDTTYLIGDQGEERSFILSKADLCHKLAAYTAISQLHSDTTIVQIAMGCPVSIYKNKNLRDEYKQYMLGNQLINFAVNGKQHSFVLENILILPEGTGVVYTHPFLFKGKRTAVIDLGGLNMNFTLYDNLIPEVSSMFTVNHGANELETILVNELNAKYGIVLRSKDAAYILNQGGLKLKGQLDSESKTIVNRVLQGYLLRIDQEIKKNNYNPDTLDLVFVGGTSILIRQKIKETFPHSIIINNAQWCNAEGFLRIGEIKYGKTNPVIC